MLAYYFLFTGGRPWYYGMEQGRTPILPYSTDALGGWLGMHLKHFGAV